MKRNLVLLAFVSVLLAIALVLAFGALDAERRIVAEPLVTAAPDATTQRASGAMPVPFEAGHAAHAPDGAPAAAAERQDVASAPRLARVVGRVVDEHDQPLAGVRVSANVQLFPITRRRARIETEADGSFVFDRLIPGRAVLSFRKRGYCSMSLRPHELEIGETLRLETVRLFRGAEVVGLVRVDGEPAAGVQLWILRATEDRVQPDGVTVVSGADGTFRVREPLPPGRYRVLVMSALQLGPLGRVDGKLVAAEFDLVAGQDGHTLQLDLQRPP